MSAVEGWSDADEEEEILEADLVEEESGPGTEVVRAPVTTIERRPSRDVAVHSYAKAFFGPFVLPSWPLDRAEVKRRSKSGLGFVLRGRLALVIRGLGSVVLLLSWTPRGLGRAVKALSDYLYDHDSAKMRAGHAAVNAVNEYERVGKRRSANLKARWLTAATVVTAALFPVLAWTAPYLLSGILGAVAAVWIVKMIPGRSIQEVFIAAGAGLIIWQALPYALVRIPVPPDWVWLALTVGSVVVLGWIGRPRNKGLPLPFASPVTGALSAAQVIDALLALGVSKMKAPEQVEMLNDPHRSGPGVQYDLQLPAGVTVDEVQKKQEIFAGALRRNSSMVWPAQGPMHPAHLVLFIADRPMSETSQEEWPLLHAGAVNIFKPFKAFTDRQGRWIEMTLAYASMIIGAIPRMGKTFVVRQILLVAGLDPRTKVAALDGKGTGDFACLRPYLDFYSVGEDEEELDRVLEFLRWAVEEMNRRAAYVNALAEQDLESVRESKITDELAHKAGFEPIVIGIDETQTYFEEAPKEVREEAVRLVTKLVKKGPALAIMVVLATQQVTKNTIPTSISNNAVIRFCLKVEGQDQNNRILGVGARSRGIDAGMFGLEDKGIGYLRSEGVRAQVARSVEGLDAVAAFEVAKRIRKMRKREDRLTGQALNWGSPDRGPTTRTTVVEGESAPPAAPELATDLAAVFRTARVKGMTLDELCDALPKVHSSYARLSTKALAKRLRGIGLEPRAVHSTRLKKTGYGIKVEDLDGAEPPAPELEQGSVVDITAHFRGAKPS